MGTTTPTTGAGVGTSRFPIRARNAVSGGKETPETKILSSRQGWTESARNAVRAHPIAVVGVAIVVGLLVGRL